MKRTALAAVLVTVIGISSVAIVYYWANRFPPLEFKHPPMIDPQIYPFSLNVTQGATFQVNLTITSDLDSEVSVPLESLSLEIYNNTGEIPLPQERIFNYTFSSNPLNLAPFGANSSIITVKLADDAPIGDYVMYVTLGSAKLTYVYGSNFFLKVTSP